MDKEKKKKFHSHFYVGVCLGMYVKYAINNNSFILNTNFEAQRRMCGTCILLPDVGRLVGTRAR